MRLVVFRDYLTDWFEAMYPPKPGYKRDGINNIDDIERIADLLYESRPQLSAGEVADILRQSRAPTEWTEPGACVGAGTIVLRQSVAFCEAQEAFHNLRRALKKWAVELRSERGLTEERQIFLADKGADATGANWTRAEEIEALIRELSTAERYRDLRARSPAQTWHFSAVFLYDRYNQIVGRSAPTAKGPAVRFVQKMLERLQIITVDGGAVEKVLRRGVRELRAYGIETKTTKTGSILSPPDRR